MDIYNFQKKCKGTRKIRRTLFACSLFFTIPDLSGAARIWDVNADGNWTTDANWDGTRPNAADDTATFDSSITATTADRIVTIDGNIAIGTLILDDDHSLSFNGANAMTFDVTAGTASLDINSTVGNGAHNLNANLVLNDTLNIDQGSMGALDINGDVSGMGGITVSGSTGDVRLGGDNNYFGTTTISSGTVYVDHLNALGDIGVATQTDVQSGAGLVLNVSGTLNNENFSIAGTGSAASGGAIDLVGAVSTTLTGTIAMTADSTVDVGDASAVLQFSNAVTGNFALTKAGAGKLELSGTNSYNGDTIVDDGTLEITAADRISDSSDLVMSGGTFNSGGYNETMLNLSLTEDSIIDMGAGSSVLNFSVLDENSWTGTLKIYNWSGVRNTAGGTDQLLFTDVVGFDKQSQILFYSDSGTTKIANTFRFRDVGGGVSELLPAPEPGTVIGVVLLLITAIGTELRRRSGLRDEMKA